MRILKILAAFGLAVPALAEPQLGGGYEIHANEHAFAYEVLEDLNAHSIFVDLEYCGFIFYDSNDALRATEAEKGRPASCLPVLPEGDVRVVASYHTHAAFDAMSFNEYPSEQDMEGDFANRQNGYIATPGGRLWFVERRKRAARVICGYRCLPYDRRYRETRQNQPRERVTLDDLAFIFAQGL